MEDFGYKKDEEQSAFLVTIKKAFLIAATLFSLAAFVYITISAYYFVYEDKNSEVETIKSPEMPIKVVEGEYDLKNPMKIDRSIYEDIFGNKKESLKHDNVKLRSTSSFSILQSKNSAKESDKIVQGNIHTQSEQQNKKEEKEKIKDAKDAKDEIVEKTEDGKIIVYSNQALKERESKDLLTNSNVEKESASVGKQSQNTRKKRIIRVQVAAMTSFESAEENWKKLNRLYPAFFSGLEPFIEKVDLGKRGIFYRLQIGNFFNQVDAEEFCNRYVAQTQKNRADCIVVE